MKIKSVHKKYSSIDSSKYVLNVVLEGNTYPDFQLSVPVNPDNTHYAAILEWAEEDGNTIEEAD
tara:strand:+ start:380 stop:571 length:192 start_codon:yes stop_codon:yes gene_type:complete